MSSQKKAPIIIGVTGGSGSGKTTVSQAIAQKFANHSVMLLPQDAYYKRQDVPFEQRQQTNYDHPDAFDNDLLIEQALMLKNHQAIEQPVYDYKIHNRTEEIQRVEPQDVIILEGILVLADARLRDLMDIKVYVDTDDDIRLLRRMHRDMESRGRTFDDVVGQYLKTVKPMFHEFIEPTKRYADLIVPEGGNNRVAIDLLVTKIQSILNAD
ncbi:uridine kinase [Latilactobacillus curvatus]|uniref:Uridine kinase n=1 Tax=Latilactobacillus curvatus JCM 1096 = DSM 20019 TaxID=1293592 RepID=A0AAJ0LFC9_LATCU|nr:uridine kinase [Latilactobacillus curvatus]KRK93005.1 uridine kinase [Latilactobacillus curvatus JCM 1096 = DSM 20019]MCP8866345.1 uridine kinase [Latilactobacillus curvatus]MCP8869755.1 uridine kinase [Latilactobacillus curvatus]MCP8876966.1 uridine kinase [Latilactobacillus curvatus]MCS8617451.1 uridine kinase [Latilactobacillus curvatus]